MAVPDPARAVKRTPIEHRTAAQTACRQVACQPVASLLAGERGWPVCVVCVHEGLIRRQLAPPPGSLPGS